MKTIIAGAIALTLAGGSAALAQPYGYDRAGPQGYHNDYRHGPERHAWRRGDRLPSSYRAGPYVVDYRRHHLRAPPRGYAWRQVDNNYVLAALATGLIAEVIANR